MQGIRTILRRVFRIDRLDANGLQTAKDLSWASGLGLRLLLGLRAGVFGRADLSVSPSYRELCVWLDPAFEEDDSNLAQAHREVRAALRKLEEKAVVARGDLVLKVTTVGLDRDLLPIGLIRHGWLSGPDTWMFTGSTIHPYLTGAELLVLIRCLALARRHRLVPPARGIRLPTVSRYFRLTEATTGLSAPTQKRALEGLSRHGLIHVRRAQGARWLCVLDPDLDARPRAPTR